MATKVAVVDIDYIRSESKMLASRITAWRNAYREDYYNKLAKRVQEEKSQVDSHWYGGIPLKNVGLVTQHLLEHQKILARLDGEAMADVSPEVNQSIDATIRQLVAEQGIDLLLQANNTILFMTDTVNLTDDVLAIHNA